MARQTAVKDYLNQLETFLNLYLVEKAPNLPLGLKNFIVTVLPYLITLLVVLSVLGLLRTGSILIPGNLAAFTSSILFTLTFVIGIAQLVLQIMALKGLFKKQRKGWALLFYVSLLGVLTNLIILNLAGLIIGSLISFYLLFQIREYYK